MNDKEIHDKSPPVSEKIQENSEDENCVDVSNTANIDTDTDRLKDKDKTKKNSFVLFLTKTVNKRIIAAIFIVFMLTIYFTQHIIALQQDISPRFSDNQFMYSLYYYDHFFHNGFVELSRNPYPPLTHLTTIPLYAYFGVSDHSAYMGMFIYLIIFFLAILGIGYELGGWSGGAVSMALAMASPRIAFYSRTYFLDFPQTAMTALAFYFLLKTRGFQDRKYSIIFALSLMLSFMTKWSAAFYLIAPVIWFFIPLLLKSKRSFKCGLILLLPLMLIIYGTFNFFKQLSPESLDNKAWYFQFLLMAALPCLLCFGTTFVMEKLLKKKEDFNSKDLSIFNFGYMASLFFILTLPWFYWSSIPFISKALSDTGAGRNYAQNWKYILNIVETDFSFVLPLMVIGFVFMFIKRDKLYMKLSVPVSLLLGLLIMTRTSFPIERYHITFLVFSAVLAGYWVSYMGSLRKVVAGLLIAVSLFSLLWWTFESSWRGYDKKFEKAGFVLNGGPLHPVTGNLDSVIAHLKDVGPHWRNVIFYFDRDFYCYPEYFCLKAYSQGKKIEMTFGGAINSPEALEEHLRIMDRRSSRVIPLKTSFTREILFMYRKERDIKPIKRKMMKLFSRMRWREKEFIVGDDYRILLVEIDNPAPFPNLPGSFY